MFYICILQMLFLTLIEHFIAIFSNVSKKSEKVKINIYGNIDKMLNNFFPYYIW